MKQIKSFLRKKFLKIIKNKKNLEINFNFNIIFNLIKKKFGNKKITIAGYYPSYYEVNILEFLKTASKKNFKVALPVVESSKSMSFQFWSYMDPLYVNNFGILEPKKTKKKIIPDVILVPLVAFDKNLNRIGHGKGYYDRALKKNKNDFIALGIAYSFQKCRTIPVNKYDFKLDYIFTDQGIIS
tara:strand:- start:5981 stop:6532 length:552 start_codon:yes stop_codon:yes gene_type:complete